jgi:hypothetical protein
MTKIHHEILNEESDKIAEEKKIPVESQVAERP